MAGQRAPPRRDGDWISKERREVDRARRAENLDKQENRNDHFTAALGVARAIHAEVQLAANRSDEAIVKFVSGLALAIREAERNDEAFDLALREAKIKRGAKRREVLVMRLACGDSTLDRPHWANAAAFLAAPIGNYPTPENLEEAIALCNAVGGMRKCSDLYTNTSLPAPTPRKSKSKEMEDQRDKAFEELEELHRKIAGGTAWTEQIKSIITVRNVAEIADAMFDIDDDETKFKSYDLADALAKYAYEHDGIVGEIEGPITTTALLTAAEALQKPEVFIEQDQARAKRYAEAIINLIDGQIAEPNPATVARRIVQARGAEQAMAISKAIVEALNNPDPAPPADPAPAPAETPEQNPDGIGLPGCKIIYSSEGQAGEYAALTANPYRGCGHGCKYCYVPRVTRQKRVEFDAGAIPKPDYLNLLIADAKKYQAAGITEQVTLSFSSDPYHAGDTTLTRQVLIALRNHGLAFCILSKGGTRALRDLDLFRPDRDAYGASLTTLDDDFSLKWEPNAPLPMERITALQEFNKAGIFTKVSLEPTLDIEASLKIVRATYSFVDLFKIGKVNYCGELGNAIDWRDYTLRMIDVLGWLGKAHYFKKDLQDYLPPDYHNPMRVPQHH
jgi:Radical SAM superfamily